MAGAASAGEGLAEELRRMIREVERATRDYRKRIYAQRGIIEYAEDLLRKPEDLDHPVFQALAELYIEALKNIVEQARMPDADIDIISEENGKVIVVGKTYNVRDILKRHGFRFDWNARAWFTNKQVDVEGLAEELKARGYTVHIVKPIKLEKRVYNPSAGRDEVVDIVVYEKTPA